MGGRANQMFKKAFISAGVISAAVLMSIPAGASPTTLQANFGKYNRQATIEHRLDKEHGWRTTLDFGHLNPGTYKYSISESGVDASGKAATMTVDVDTQTLKTGQTVFATHKEQLPLASNWKQVTLHATVVQVGANGATTSLGSA